MTSFKQIDANRRNVPNYVLDRLSAMKRRFGAKSR